eukprot:Nitzschia sp. Nitz4//scaffold60_size111251//18533//21999//NITZ4_004140-RA/size111251-augustus-gene-0.119-mRNA-1//-1//CDS//3329555543//4483//frame0
MSTSINQQLLEALLSPNGDIRSQAETVYQSVAAHDRIPSLLQLATQGTPVVAHMAVVLLRRNIVLLDNAQVLSELASPLLQAFGVSSSKSNVQTGLGHCLSQLCQSLMVVQPDSVPTLLSSLWAQLEAPCRQGHVPALQLLASLAEMAPAPFLSVIASNIPSLWSEGWSADANKVWIDIVVATATVTEQNPTTNLDQWVVDSSSPSAQLGPTLLPVLSALPSSPVCSTLQQFSHAAISCPSLLAGNTQVLTALVETCLGLASSPSFSTEVQLAALQVLASLVSVGDIKRRCLPSPLATSIGASAITRCVEIMVNNAGDDEDWALDPATLVQDAMDDDETDECLFARSLLESFILELGALSVLLPLAESLLKNASTQRIALVVLECAILTAPVSIAQHLPVVLQAAIGLSDSNTGNPRIQYQALRVLATLCATHVQTILEGGASHAVLERFASGWTSPVSKVSVTSSLGIVSYCRSEERDDVVETLTPLASQLLAAMVQGPLALSTVDTASVAVRVRAMGAVACLAEALGEGFAPYYGQILPGLLATAQLNSIDLAGAAMEAATIVGQAVGREYFEGDAQQLLQWILPALQTDTSMLEPLLLASARIASVLEEDFAPHAHAVMTLLMTRVQQQPEVGISEGTEGDLGSSSDSGVESMTVAVPGRGFTKVSINTSKIQEQVLATRAVYELAKAMGASFDPYIQHCLDTFLPLVAFPYSSDLRSTSAQTVAAVFEAACLAGENQGMETPQKVFPLAVRVVSKQLIQEDPVDMEAMYGLADSLSELFYIVYRYRKSNPEILSQFGLSDAKESIQCCRQTMASCLERRAQITTVMSGALSGDDELDAYNAQLTAEQQLLTPLVDSVGYTLKFNPKDMLTTFEEQIIPLLGPKLADQSDMRASLAAICLFDDIIEHCGPEAATKHTVALERGIVTVLEQHPDDLDLVQAAVYGICQIARYGPRGSLSAHLPSIFRCLLDLTNKPKDQTGDYTYLSELAASAIMSLSLLGPFGEIKFVSRDTLLTSCLNHMPVLHDEDEAKICHAGLCQLIESGVVQMDQHATRVTQIIGQVLTDSQEGDDLATADTLERMSTILYRMQQGLSPSTMQSVLASLDPEIQHVVGSVLMEVGRSRANLVTP